MNRLRLGTRSSALALWQAEHVAGRLGGLGVETERVELSSLGDRDLSRPIGELSGSAPFADDLEQALADGEVDLVVHSLKDLDPSALDPSNRSTGLEIGAVLDRADPGETLVSRFDLPLAELPAGATIGTSSPRRVAQVRLLAPQVDVVPIRGPVDDRINQVQCGHFDAAVLAAAGLARLDRLHEACELFPLDRFLPAPAQGALAVQIRQRGRASADRAGRDEAIARLVRQLDHLPTRAAVTAELLLLERFGDGDRRILAACARPVPRTLPGPVPGLQLRARLFDREGQVLGDAELVGTDPHHLARRAGELLAPAAAA